MPVIGGQRVRGVIFVGSLEKCVQINAVFLRIRFHILHQKCGASRSCEFSSLCTDRLPVRYLPKLR